MADHQCRLAEFGADHHCACGFSAFSQLLLEEDKTQCTGTWKTWGKDAFKEDKGAGTGLSPARMVGHLRELRINTLGGNHLCDVFAELDWTIAAVKTAIASQSHVPQYQQQLLHGNAILADADKVANLRGDEPLHLMLLLRTPEQMLDVFHDTSLGKRLRRVWCEHDHPTCIREVLSVVTYHGSLLEHAGISLLEHAGIELQDDHDIVMAAVQNDGAALFHASARLRANDQIVMAAVQSYGLSLCAAGDRCRSDPKIAFAAAKQNGLAAQMSLLQSPGLCCICDRPIPGISGTRLLRAAWK